MTVPKGLPPELGDPIRVFESDRMRTWIAFGIAGVLALIAIAYFALLFDPDLPFPLVGLDRLHRYLVAGFFISSVIAASIGVRSKKHRVVICSNGMARLLGSEAQFSTWSEMTGMECKRGEKVRFDTDGIAVIQKVGRGWAVIANDVRDFAGLCAVAKEECSRRGLTWKEITIPA